MTDKLSLAICWDDHRASRAVVFWACVASGAAAFTVGLASIAATLIMGFAWGALVRGGTAQDMATNAATNARAELAAAVCMHQFVSGANATSQLASLKAADSRKLDSFIEDGGWVTLPGAEKPIIGAAKLCAQRLMDATLPSAKAAGASGQSATGMASVKFDETAPRHGDRS